MLVSSTLDEVRCQLNFESCMNTTQPLNACDNCIGKLVWGKKLFPDSLFPNNLYLEKKSMYILQRGLLAFKVMEYSNEK